MIHQWQQFLRRPLVWISISSSILLNLVSWGVLFINISPTSDLIVLHYTLYFGVDKVGPWRDAFIFPSIGLIIILVNYLFAMYFEKRSTVLSYFFLALTPAYQLLVFFAVIFLIIANSPAQI